MVFREACQAGLDLNTFTPRLTVARTQGTVEEVFQRFVTNFEDMLSWAHSSCTSLFSVKKFLGRSRPKKILQPMHAPVVRAPRHGEPVPLVDDAPTKLRQHIRQCRRVASAMEQLLSYTRTRSESALEAALKTWYAVTHAPGFKGGFATFVWDQFGIQIPEFISAHDVAILRLLSIQMSQQQQPRWVQQLARAREHSHKLFLNDDWAKEGKFHALEIKPPPKPEIAMMDIPEPGTITRL